MKRKCNHPDHLKNLENSRKKPVTYLKGNGTKDVIEPLTDIYINTKRYGEICGNCWAYEMGAYIEENPIVSLEDSRKLNASK